jgi:uncharacterized protein YjbI with pentapeptide repeats
MKFQILATLAVATLLSSASPAWAENLAHTQQLLNTRQCSSCELSRAGFVLVDLTGVDLSDANLSQANLSQATLRDANLRGANLSGAVLFGADLTGADLSGANLSGADLREAYMSGVTLAEANLQGTNLLGAIGLSSEIATPEQLYLWGLAETQRGNFRGAIAYYNQALSLKPDFAHALLARGIARFRLRDMNGAIADGKQAEQLYITQANEEGHQMSVQFYEGLEAMQEAMAEGNRGGGGGSFLGFLGSLTSVLMRVLF